LNFGDDKFISLEAAGVKEARNAAFVLVAGGLGERLGYKGIKVCAELLIAYLISNHGKG
jgi:UDP-sugar pyrophosphorylase